MVCFAPRLRTQSFILCALLHLASVSANDNCTTEGELRQDLSGPVGSIADRLLQVCHIGQWRYVCSSPFNHNIDGKIVLRQLQCNGGGTSRRPKTGTGYQLAGVSCSGVERRLIECPRYLRLRERESTVTQCAQKITVECDKNASSTSQCQNGELKRNETNNILYICVSGTWRTMCSNFGGPAQVATVACRQLNQGRSSIRATTYTVQTTETPPQFRYYFHCTGQEKKLTECTLTQVLETSLCNRNPLAVTCTIVPTPMELILTPKSGFTVEANWTQSTLHFQHYIYPTTACTSINKLYATTQYVYLEVSAAGNEKIHMMISALMPNTSYNCCVSVHTELGRSEEVCDHVTTGMPSSSSPMDEISQSGASAWVGGIIIGAVLATVTLFIVWAAVWMIRRRQHSIMPNNSKERIETFASQTNGNTPSSGVVNHAYYRPQPYEETQIREPEYSYADHDLASNANIYDTVMEQSKDTHSGDYAESSFGADNNTDVLQEVKNTLYEGGQETSVYSKLAQK